MSLFENIINHKVNTITGKELFQYGKQFNVNLTIEQANKIASYLRGKKINLFSEKERGKVLKDIAVITDKKTAEEINLLFKKFTK